MIETQSGTLFVLPRTEGTCHAEESFRKHEYCRVRDKFGVEILACCIEDHITVERCYRSSTHPVIFAPPPPPPRSSATGAASMKRISPSILLSSVVYYSRFVKAVPAADLVYHERDKP